jgi:hypothetical protein
VNARSKDLACIAASVARESTARASRVDVNEAQRSSDHPVRAKLHGVMTVALAVTVGVLAFEWSEERDLRRQAETKLTEVIVARLPTALPAYRSTPWPVGLASILHAGAAPTSAAQVASSPNSRTASGSQDHAADFPLQQLRKQLSDPATRNALRDQQRGAVLQMYGDLLRSWHLAVDKSDRVLDLLAEQQLEEMEQSLNASDPGSTVAARASTEATRSATADDLNAMLTDQQHKELQRQRDSLSERLTVGSLADELSLAQMPLTDAQREQLTQVMVDERKAVPVPDLSSFPANSPYAQRALEDWQSELDQRVQDRAATILTSAQQTRYEQFMTRQREARNAFASFEVAQSGDNGSGATPPGAIQPGATPP